MKVVANSATQARDGPRYKGRGYLQIVGRANYKNYSERLGLGSRLVELASGRQ